MAEKHVYLMRGLPSCGKSYTAKRLAGGSGLICETDAYFHTQVGDDPSVFDFKRELLQAARDWNFERFREAVDRGVSPVVVDRGNSLGRESQRYARYAVDSGYVVELREPDSPWWQEIRVLLKYKKWTQPVLDAWAERLARLSRATHRVSVRKIRRRMETWKWDLSVDDILSFDATAPSTLKAARRRIPARAPVLQLGAEQGDGGDDLRSGGTGADVNLPVIDWNGRV